MLYNDLSIYLTLLGAPLCQEYVTWGKQLLQVRSYLGSIPPPHAYVTSARCVVLCGDQVLAVRDPDEIHIIPGGRIGHGETFEQATIREVAEETGWRIGDLRLLGVKHFHHLSPKPAGYAYPFPDFLQLIYMGEGLAYDESLREINGYELAAEFVSVTGVTVSALRMSERHFLAAARRQLLLSNSSMAWS